MFLKTVEISNFRSIDSLKLDFTVHRAIGLVGVNESGKSNILRALALISPDQKPVPGDIRVQRASEPDIDEASVVFSIELTAEEASGLIEGWKSLVVAKDGELPTFKGTDIARSFAQFAESHRVGRLIVNLLDQSATVFTERIDAAYADIDGQWSYVKTPANAAAVPVEVPWLNPPSKPIGPGALINVGDFETAPSIPGAVPLDAAILYSLWEERVATYVKANMPKGLLWSYEKENLLPSSVSLDAFCADPRSCRPLQSMFEIAGIDNIAQEVAKEKTRGRHRLDNLLRRVSDRAAQHIRGVWKDYKAASIELLLDGTEIRISVRDDNLSFAFEDRSDGFKRFITFLLLISAKVKTSSLENVLLLIDEPEISLHPAGVRNLRDELLRISERNLVVFATHSPQMIDRRCIERHVVVKKVNEVTMCEYAGNGRVFDEEVLLNSLGVSVFESLKPVNVIFEGWRDKKLFEVFRDANKKTPEYETLHQVGAAFVSGVKDVKNVVPLLALASTRVHVVSDHDDPALEARKAFNEARFDSDWVTYRELEGVESLAVTAEDFVKATTLRKAFDTLCEKNGLEGKLSDADFGGAGHLAVIEARLKRSGIDKERLKALLHDFKSLVFDHLKASQIDDRYASVMKSLASKCAI